MARHVLPHQAGQSEAFWKEFRENVKPVYEEAKKQGLAQTVGSDLARPTHDASRNDFQKVGDCCPVRQTGSSELNRCQAITPQRTVWMGNFLGNEPTAECKLLISETNLRYFE
jgi:hypothetical protein